MSAAEKVIAKDELRSLLLKHGLDLSGTIGTSLTWESPIKIFRSSHVDDAEIGAYSYISPKSEIRHTTVGRYCSIGDNVDMRGSAHPKEWLSSHPFPFTNLFSASRPYRPPLTFDGYPKKTKIGHDVWVGSRAIILPGVTVGTGAVIGAGAVVVKDVPAYAIHMGIGRSRCWVIGTPIRSPAGV
ncbi:CatB-related O-acetyltransferase [Microvirga calopogonii]|uniref:CatB-related O-acetyltransferase n=1 Tax=Microvirga calopogonii TaxID=2078013 RepID=UPI000E0E018A|nr:CatB-related O-acetyltransferase [Microvirga calopogonii]